MIIISVLYCYEMDGYSFSRECIKQSVMQSSEAEVKCPFNDKYECNAVISEREIKAVSEITVVF